MGYYTGSGVVTGGSVRVNLRSTGPDIGGAYYSYNRTYSTTTVKNGVSLSDAQSGNAGDINLNYWQWPGGKVESACRGSQSYSSYSRIGESNLYVLTKVTETIQVRGKQGSYDSGWVG